MDKRRKTERKIRRGEKMRERDKAYMAADRWEEGGNGENREEHRREKLRERGKGDHVRGYVGGGGETEKIEETKKRGKTGERKNRERGKGRTIG